MVAAAQVTQEPNTDNPQKDIVFAKIEAPRVTMLISAPAGLGGNLTMRGGDQLLPIESCSAAEATEQNPWVLNLVRNSRYELSHTDEDQSGKSVIIDLSNSEENPYVVRYQP